MAERCCHNPAHSHDHAHAHVNEAESLVAAGQAMGQAPHHAPGGSGTSTAMRIMQMDCPTEEALIRKRLEGMPAVYDIRFNLMQRVLTVRHAKDGLPDIMQALRSIGFEPELPQSGDRFDALASRDPDSGSAWRLGVALALALTAELISGLQGLSWLSLVLALVAIALSGISTYRKGLIAIVNRNLNINALMSIAVTGAVLLGEWPEAAMVMVLFVIAEAIEARSLDRARQSVERLMEVAPEVVCVRQPDGHWHDVPAADVGPGAMVRARPGERIGLDGIITEGISEVNQAPITGESALVAKTNGDVVYAGTINGTGELQYRVTAGAGHTMLARIMHAVHDAQARKAPTQRFIDRFARVYTPVVCILALGVALIPPLFLGAGWYEWIYRALVLLVIACPCALVISTPVAVVSALGMAARQGILIKGGVYLEQGRHLKWLALDKTGTLTTGRPQLLTVQVLQSDVSQAQCLQLAAGMARRSDHPVSQAIASGTVDQVADSVLADNEIRDFQAVPGGGVQATINGRNHYLGSPQWVDDLVASRTPLQSQHAAIAELQQQGKTVAVLADQERVLALFVVADTVRDSARQAVEELHDLGVRTVMLSGDSAASAQYAARQAGVDEVRAGLLPHEKLAEIERFMQQGKTGMVGDGINDAPALARADIGFAMGVAGTDTALETADVALMDDDLRKVPRFIRLSQATFRILIQNIAVALGLKAVFLVMAVLGIATMWMAVFSDVGASLIVLANSLRLFRQ